MTTAVGASTAGAQLIILAIELGISAFVFWAVFEKAGVPGWWSIIPVVYLYGLAKVAGRSGWWVLWLIIPIVNIIFWIILCVDVSKAFGHGGAFAIGLILLPFIFYPILGFGSSTYRGTVASTPARAPY